MCWKQGFHKRFSGHSYVKLIKAGLCTNAKEHALVYGAFATDKRAGKSPFSCSESQASDHIKSIYIINNPSPTCQIPLKIHSDFFGIIGTMVKSNHAAVSKFSAAISSKKKARTKVDGARNPFKIFNSIQILPLSASRSNNTTQTNT